MAKKWKRNPSLLILPNVPQKLHGVNPRSILGPSWWDKVRKEAYASTNYHCMACGVHKSKGKLSRYLEGHEVYNIVYQSGLMEYIRTVPLCTACHMYLHMGRLKWLHKSRRITDARYTSIIYHGDKVLSTAGLSFRDKITGPENLVETWRLVMNGKVVAER